MIIWRIISYKIEFEWKFVKNTVLEKFLIDNEDCIGGIMDEEAPGKEPGVGELPFYRASASSFMWNRCWCKDDFGLSPYPLRINGGFLLLCCVLRVQA